MTQNSSFFSALKAGFKRLSCLLMVGMLVLSASFNPAQAASGGNPLYASLVMDADTGLILSQSNANKRLHPASLTKVMTLLMLFEAVEKGDLTMQSRIPISRHAAGMAPSKIGLAAGSSIEVEDAIYALVTKSANDIAAAVGEKLGGTESNFGRLMTARAKEIGMTDTLFVNASGLHDPRQISTARDMARLARVVISDYPSYYRYFSTKNFNYRGQNYHNHNRLMDTYKGMDGMKTGYIGPSGFNLVASAVQNNHRLIGVVFGGRTTKTRNAHMAGLLDAGFERLKDMRGTSEPLVASADVPLPKPKPQILMAMASLNNIAPASAEAPVIGEGDYEPAQKQTISAAPLEPTDILQPITTAAAPAPQTLQVPDQPPQIIVASVDPAATNTAAGRTRAYVSESKSTWGVQIGAFASRAATDQAIQQSLRSLPQQLAQANPIIMPLRTEDGFLFRGRINGYSREDAFKVCTYLSECMPVPPQE